MARRSSARLRGRNSSTPQNHRFIALPNDGPIKTAHTAPKLTSCAEEDEMPGAFPRSVSPPSEQQKALAKHIAKAVTQKQVTPTNGTPVKPSPEEMHPQLHRLSTAKSQDEARWLGFSNIAPHTEPSKGTSKIAVAQGTPTKAEKISKPFTSPDFQFTFRRQSLELSPEARQLMAEKREEAAKIREQMVGDVESYPNIGDVLGRKIATPKGKSGRFSDAHKAAFKKMDSIADHPSKFRANQNRLDTATASLKRTISKAELDGPDDTGPKPVMRTQSKADLNSHGSAIPRSKLTKTKMANEDEVAGSNKRVKRAKDDDASAARPLSQDAPTDVVPTTPQKTESLRLLSNNPVLAASASTPTQASLARANSVKSIKGSMIPALVHSPSKVSLAQSAAYQDKPSTPLLARSPMKAPVGDPIVDQPKAMMNPLLARSPAKFSFLHKPAKPEQEGVSDSHAVPLLARSPSKAAPAERTEMDVDKPSCIPLLARSPSKIALTGGSQTGSNSPTKTGGTNLMSRFNLLRASPVKSILRSPQRLYSNDPVKVASGTHFATPPKATSNMNKELPPVPSSPVLTQKHVDFTASTKANKEAAKESSTSPEEAPTPPPKDMEVARPLLFEPTPIDYPGLPSDGVAVVPTPKPKRRQTMAAPPGDFTFRVGTGITFGPSPTSKPATFARRPSIRHVPSTADASDTATAPTHATSKKRKLDPAHSAEGKENVPAPDDDGDDDEEGETRPSKRAKPSGPEPRKPTKMPTKPPAKVGGSRLPQLLRGKDKGKDAAKGRPSMLSQARLNMLAMPKRRRE
ncbi:hypothetical protein LTR66_009300 [Elasticomyces elasticus]|nr:hypothetical protein LTR66_009300 [Elasticomyces elasticus]